MLYSTTIKALFMTKSSAIPAAVLPAPLSKQKIENEIANTSKIKQQTYLLVSTLLYACIFYLILSATFAQGALEKLYFFLSVIHGFTSLVILLSYLDDDNHTNYKAVIKRYSAVDIEDYKALLELKNKYKAIAEYTKKVRLDDREILNIELKLFKDYEKKYSKSKTYEEHEQAKTAFYLCDSKN